MSFNKTTSFLIEDKLKELNPVLEALQIINNMQEKI
jgi:hypothetical protein